MVTGRVRFPARRYPWSCSLYPEMHESFRLLPALSCREVWSGAGQGRERGPGDLPFTADFHLVPS